MSEKEYFRRNLPHFHPRGELYFITYRLYATLPKKIIQELENEIKTKSEKGISKDEFFRIHLQRTDTYLDQVKKDCKYLENPEVAKIVSNSLHHHDNKDYFLICYCIMPNHVHLVFEHFSNGKSVSNIMKSIKGYSAFKCNKILNRKGVFWQHESYDRIIRSQKELSNVIDYVLENPVAAGLVDDWQKWPYTYIHKDYL
jgi:putative transposase